MRHFLNRHPDTGCDAIRAIEAYVARSGGQLTLRYVATGGMEGVALPPLTASARSDELWKHTCFEAFVRADGEAGYLEFNVSPSTQWAAYAFDSYRDGMRPLDAQPRIEVKRAPDRFELNVTLDVPLPADARWRLGLCAVIEETNGAKSYWALAHPPGTPDFHHPDAFALELPAAERT